MMRITKQRIRPAGADSMPILLLAPLMILLLLPVAVHAESGTGSSPFIKGTARFSVLLGGATAFDQSYTIAGIGGGYFVADGIEIGLDADAWFGNSPRIYEAGPRIGIVLNTDIPLKPYLGAFYRRTHIDGYRDNDTVGARAGVYFLTGRSAYFSIGLAQDIHLNCDRTVYASCTEIYPEIAFIILFR
ncbi:MAG: hypothetical protein ACM3MD_01670 [Betaproteobacteria bacterium]